MNQFPIVLQEGPITTATGDTLRTTASVSAYSYLGILRQMKLSQVDIHRITMILNLLSSFQQNIRVIPAELPSALIPTRLDSAHLNDQRPVPTLNPRQRIIATLLLHRQIELTIPTPTLLF
jgi:hypothetical protein